jgi:hypothetical protein
MIRFENDTGISRDTRIVDVATGEDIAKNIAIEYGAQITLERDMVKATCRLAMMNLSLTAGKVELETLNPVSGKYERVRAIEFRDGSRVEIAEDGTPSIVPPASEEAAA